MAVAMALVVAAGQSEQALSVVWDLCRDGRYNGAGIYNSRWLLYIMDGGKADGAFRQAGNRESCITGWKSMQRKTPVHFKIYSIIDSEMDRGFCYIL